jgi:hypothetical protein
MGARKGAVCSMQGEGVILYTHLSERAGGNNITTVGGHCLSGGLGFMFRFACMKMMRKFYVEGGKE